MGLLKAGIDAALGVLSEQWRDYIYCDALPNNVLMTKGKKRTGGSSNLLSNGSIIAVNEGQCMLIVHQGAIVDVCAESGEYLFEGSSEPSVFFGELGEQARATFRRVGERFTFRGDAANDLRVYFVNTKEIVGNKYGTPAPVTVRVVDANIGLDTDIGCRCNGEYSFRIVDPLLFYREVCGNVTDTFLLEQLSSQMRSEFLTALQPGFGRLSAMGIRFSMFPAHTVELADAMEEELSVKWTQRRGIAVVGVGINTIAALPEDEERIKQLQLTAVMRDPNMRAANYSIAQGEALKAAASNEAGAMVGFAGINMMQSAAGAMGSNGVYDTNQPYQYHNAYPVSTHGQMTSQAGWTCPNCGTQNSGKFCQECGTPMPVPSAPVDSWICPSCGNRSTGKFCQECGTKRPAGEWTCSCGHVNASAAKFCMECGNPRP